MYDRVNCTSFMHLLNLIKDDSVFCSKGKKLQLPVQYQLAAFLGWFGSKAAIKVGIMLGISKGSVYHACAWVTCAFWRICHNHVLWPNAEEWQVMKLNMQELRFPGAVAVVDGTLVQLQDKPCDNPWAYWSWKKMYAVSEILNEHMHIKFKCV